MRTSCNACRVLRKRCSDDCCLRPCLHWIKSSDSQSKATIFLAKFYGRAGLLNLINAGPDHLRPAIFRSLLYEACGRIINPVSGSVGLLCSNNWDKCQAAVDSVLSGSTLKQVDELAAAQPIMPFKGCDIRHLTKGSNEIHRVQTQTRFKRSGGRCRTKSRLVSVDEVMAESTQFSISGWVGNYPEERNVDPSHDSSTLFSAETVEASLANRVVKYESQVVESEVELELCLSFNPVLLNHIPTVEEQQTVINVSDGDA
ncbi:hypothetical protein RHSIM_Rhsim12G0084700 [Rhododendron simsii]|uniref:LOB domain-containing protein n=1 Tax=Rhododendron simsii TaxID=118357 RepID=A0A834G3C8_RHOSS|nr:hypothetical protein RHSIM_Rhsim12G0084700 [Rhododendron simsii]